MRLIGVALLIACLPLVMTLEQNRTISQLKAQIQCPCTRACSMGGARS